MDDLLDDFLLETADNLSAVEAELVAFEADPSRRGSLDAVFRAVHTLKGACGFLRLPRLEALAHAVESVLTRLRRAPEAAGPDTMALVFRALDLIRDAVTHLELVGVEPSGSQADLIAALERAGADPSPTREPPTSVPRGGAPDAAEAVVAAPAPSPPPAPAPDPPKPDRVVRVGVEVLNELSAGVEELVRTRNQLLELLPSVGEAALRAPLQRLSVITGELQDGVSRARLQPVGAAWRALPRAVRDLSLHLGKPIELRVDGGSAEVDRTVVDALREPLLHLLRNAADHGLESPAERLASGKPERGVIELAAWLEADALLLRVADDGRGLDCDGLRRAAAAQGWLSAEETAALTDGQAQRLVFAPGLSTAEKATTLSGRGVGLDAVRRAAERLGGRVSIQSTAGRGTAFTLRIPLALEAHPAEAPAPEAEPHFSAPAPDLEVQPSPAAQPEAPPAPARRVLLVEKNAFFRHMMSPLLTAAGYEVTVAASAEEAWRLHAAGADFDAVIADLNEGGEAFSRRIRDHSRWAAAPRIGLTEGPPSLTEAGDYGQVVRKSDRQGLIDALAAGLGTSSEGRAA